MLFCFFSGLAVPFSEPDAFAALDDLEDLVVFSALALSALLEPATDAAAADLPEEEERDAVVVLRDALVPDAAVPYEPLLPSSYLAASALDVPAALSAS